MSKKTYGSVYKIAQVFFKAESEIHSALKKTSDKKSGPSPLFNAK
jgi:hypothetical protein